MHRRILATLTKPASLPYSILLACVLLLAMSTAGVADAAVLTRLKQGEKLKIAAIGTSLTDANFNAKNWFAQLGDWLSSQYPGQVTMSNRAVSATASCDLPQFNRPHGGMWQLNQVLTNDDPDVVFIEFAINDAYKEFNISVADSRKNLKSMIDQIRAWSQQHGKNVEIIVQTMNNTGLVSDETRPNLGAYYQGWLEEAAANHVFAIDHYPKWLEIYKSEPDHATWKKDIPDGIHPNPAATTEVILPAIQKALTQQAAETKTETKEATAKRIAPPNPKLVKVPFAFPGLRMENTPVVYKGRPVLVENCRPLKADEQESGSYLFIEDMTTGQELARFGTGFSFVSAFVNGDEMNVFGTMNTNKEWTKDVYRFWSTDLKTWQQERVMTRDGDEHLFNTSVCRDDQGYVMAYESNKPVQWSFRFARSKDLSHWEKVQGLEFSDVEQQTACGNPTIRYFAPYYYLVYGIWRWQGPGTAYEYLLPETKYVTAIARSKDLITWEISPTREPMLDPVPGEGINNTDADLFEFEGNTYVYYATGDQATWGTIRVAMYAGPMQQMFESYFPKGEPTITFDTQKRKYTNPFPQEAPKK